VAPIQRGNGAVLNMLPGAVAVTTGVFTVSAVMAMFNALGGIVAPLPLLYYYSRMGRMRGVAIFVLSAVIATIAVNALGLRVPFIYFVLYGMAGPVLSEALRKNYSIEKTIGVSSLVVIVSGVAVLAVYSITQGTSPWQFLEASIYQMVQKKIELYKTLDIAPEQIEVLRAHAEEIAGVLIGILPALTVVGTVLFMWVNTIAGKWLFEMLGMWYPDFGNLSRWRMSDKVVWVLIATGGTLLLPVTVIRIVGLNAFFLLVFFYLLQGLAVVGFFFQVKRVPRMLQIIGYVIIFAQQFLLLIVAALGLIDVWADFRKVNKTV